MRRRFPTLVLLSLALLGTGLLAGCGGEEEEGVAVEGEPLELGNLLYNVQITRFLNPAATEDAGYLEGQPPPPVGKDYLAVFMRIQNEGDEPEPIPDSFTIRSSRDETFRPLDINENPFALPLGSEIPPDGQLPAPDTAAASGPIKGALVLYLIDEAATENRPLELEIPGPDGETGRIELDI
jgi:hypothetical protein